jgi:hypothetical protein
MTIKKIKVGHWYKTTLGFGECKRVGGTFPPTVQIEIVRPFPRGVLNLRPRDVEEEVNPNDAPWLSWRG